MATPTSRRAPAASKSNIDTVIRGKAEELLDLEIEHLKVAAHLFPKIADMEGQLKQLATESGHSFHEFYLGKGEVKGHGRKERLFRGNLPEVDPAVFNALPAAERKDLVKPLPVVPAGG